MAARDMPAGEAVGRRPGWRDRLARSDLAHDFVRDPSAIAASAIPSYAIGTVTGANHLFQAAVTGSPDEYTELAPEFAPEFLQLLTDWLTKQTSR